MSYMYREREGSNPKLEIYVWKSLTGLGFIEKALTGTRPLMGGREGGEGSGGILGALMASAGILLSFWKAYPSPSWK